MNLLASLRQARRRASAAAYSLPVAIAARGASFQELLSGRMDSGVQFQAQIVVAPCQAVVSHPAALD